MNKILFSSASIHWATPKELYRALNQEFNFNDDPCPMYGNGGLTREWGERTYCNPPYGRKIGEWLAKGYEQALKGKLVVFLIPSRTDTKWWHDYVMKAQEIRFLKGRLKFGNACNSAPFPSCIAIFQS